MDGSGPIEDVVSEQEILTGVALDLDSDRVYWGNSSTVSIHRANLDGAQREQLVGGLRGPYGIALDTAHEKMYWADINLGAIQHANLDGTDLESLVSDLSTPFGIAVQVFEGMSASSIPPSIPGFSLEQNYPNPFRNSTSIQFFSSVGNEATLRVFDTLGRLVHQVRYPVLTTGVHSVRIQTEAWADGVYIYRLASGGRSLSRTMIRIDH